MKTKLKLVIICVYIITSLISCKQDSKETKTPISTQKSSEVREKVNETIDDSNKDLNEISNAIQSVDKETIEKLYQLSGVSKKDYEVIINNSEALKKIIKKVEKNQKEQLSKPKLPLKGPITEIQLKSKKTSTGVSIEEAILSYQKELKRDLSPEKRQKVDAASGTTLFSKLNEKEAKYLVRYVNAHEGYKLKELLNKSTNLHSRKEAQVYINNLKNRIDSCKSGKIKASSYYLRRLNRFVRTAESGLKKMNKKEKIAQQNFKNLNPDLYFGEEIGETFFSSRVEAAVYLPLGKLSFADKVIKAEHPDLDVVNLNNVIGTPEISVGKIDGGVSEVDIEEFVEPGDLFYYVRLTDLELSSGIPGADVDAIAAIGAAMRLKLDSKVLFETGKSELKPEGIEALKKLAKSISILKKGNIIVEGHTDDVGETSFNEKLSLSRSKSVVTELKKLIPNSQFKWIEKGLGESKPIVKNDSEENRAKNRRVEILVVPN